jgi:tetratricopeptide (TPR) repeat protein
MSSAVRRDSWEAHGHLALRYSALGRHRESVGEYLEVVRLKADFPEAWCNLGTERLSLGEHAAAAESFRVALGQREKFPEAWNGLGVALKALGQLEQAEAAFRRASAERPGYGEAIYNLGNVLMAGGRPAEAAEAYRQALVRMPRHADAWSNLGGALLETGQAAEAELVCRRALEISPEHAGALCNLGTACLAQNRVDEANAHGRRALALQPSHAGARCLLGNALLQANLAREAEAVFAAGAGAGVDADEFRFNEALARLLQGDLAEGFRLYEHRLKTKGAALRREFSAPRLQPGTPLAGRTVLLYPEQGFGDTVQCVRHVPALVAAGARVVLEVQAPLLALMQANFPAVDVRPKGSVERGYDLHCPLLSLPFVCGVEGQSIPAASGYLRADPEQVEAWRVRLAADPGPRIGVVWAGNPKHKNDRRRSVPMATLQAAFAGCGATIYSLQKEAGPAAEVWPAAWPGLRDWTAELTDFSDTADLIAALDLVVTVDTSVAHLAGALGRPTWVLLPFAPDWRWQLERIDSPWYASMRLFRQTGAGQWGPVMEAVASALQEIDAVESRERP